METIENNLKSVENFLYNADHNMQIYFYNIYCSHTANEKIYNNNVTFLADMHKKQKILDLTDYVPAEKYVKIKNSKLISFSDPFEYIDLDNVAEHVYKNPDYYNVELVDFCY